MFSLVTKFLLCEFLMAWTLVVVACPSEWRYFDDSCYDVYYQERTFDVAAQFCKEIGGYLVEISSNSENEFVHQFLKERSVDNSAVWIGLNDINQEGIYTWFGSGRSIYDDYTNWNTGEPNNVVRNILLGYPNSGEDCVEMQYDSGKWNDIMCKADKRAPICERNA